MTPRLRRLAALLVVVVLHLWMFDLLLRQEWRTPAVPAPSVVTVSFIEDRPASRPAPPPAVRRARAIASRSPPSARRPARMTSAPPDEAPRPQTAVAPAPAARLFREDGSIALPDAVVDDLAKATDPRREFGFQVPGVVEAQARAHALKRPALEYLGTRFDEGWIEETDPLTAGLKKAVEKTTATVRIPLPRAPGSKAVCKFSFAAMSGGCGIRNESDGYVVRGDDPDTLDAAEVAQCEAWWNEVVTATTPEQLRIARDRYEAQCRKPLAAAPG